MTLVPTTLGTAASKLQLMLHNHRECPHTSRREYRLKTHTLQPLHFVAINTVFLDVCSPPKVSYSVLVNACSLQQVTPAWKRHSLTSSTVGMDPHNVCAHTDTHTHTPHSNT